MGVLVSQLRAQAMVPPHYGPPYTPINTAILQLPPTIPPPDPTNTVLKVRLDDMYQAIETARAKAKARAEK